MAAKGGRTGGKGGGGRSGGGRNSGGRGNRGGFGRGGGGRSNFQPDVICQVCGKEGHLALRCYKRFDTNYTSPPQKTASSATTPSYCVDSNWYMDTWATDHITVELDKLTVRDRYTGNDNVHAANGAGMEIDHVGHSIFVPNLVRFISITYFMFPKPIKVLFLSID
jgi:histone deacetylase 1/2